MAVIYDRNFECGDTYYLNTEDLRCAFCGEPLREPYVHWRNYGPAEDLRFCAGCCATHATGLALDFVEVEAARRMREIAPYNLRLKRRFGREAKPSPADEADE
jgi:hypothetical protein